MLKPHGELTLGHLKVLDVGGSAVEKRYLAGLLVGDGRAGIYGGPGNEKEIGRKRVLSINRVASVDGRTIYYIERFGER